MQRSGIDTINLTLDTTWESDKNTRKHLIQGSQEASPYCKAAINKHVSMTDTKHR